MKLTNTKCQNAKPQDKPYKLFDGNGLYLQVAKAGTQGGKRLSPPALASATAW
jgi:hypothetical protein